MRQVFFLHVNAHLRNTTFWRNYTTSSFFQWYKNCATLVATCSLRLLIFSLDLQDVNSGTLIKKKPNFAAILFPGASRFSNFSCAAILKTQRPLGKGLAQFGCSFSFTCPSDTNTDAFDRQLKQINKSTEPICTIKTF